jgi:hypothetical protein
MSNMIMAWSGWIKPGTTQERPSGPDNVDSRMYLSTKEREVLREMSARQFLSWKLIGKLTLLPRYDSPFP